MRGWTSQHWQVAVLRQKFETFGLQVCSLCITNASNMGLSTRSCATHFLTTRDMARLRQSAGTHEDAGTLLLIRVPASAVTTRRQPVTSRIAWRKVQQHPMLKQALMCHNDYTPKVSAGPRVRDFLHQSAKGAEISGLSATMYLRAFCILT